MNSKIASACRSASATRFAPTALCLSALGLAAICGLAKAQNTAQNTPPPPPVIEKIEPAAAQPAASAASSASTRVASADPGGPSSSVGSTPGEPNVKYTIIEDEGSRIEETKVRGTTQRVTVTPKVGTGRSYEIIMGDGSRDLTFGANTSRGAAGQRVWNIFQF
ncbi:hypothetical protein BH11PSE9_BH11PSE9_11570 [soil metagenome]